MPAPWEQPRATNRAINSLRVQTRGAGFDGLSCESYKSSRNWLYDRQKSPTLLEGCPQVEFAGRCNPYGSELCREELRYANSGTTILTFKFSYATSSVARIFCDTAIDFVLDPLKKLQRGGLKL